MQKAFIPVFIACAVAAVLLGMGACGQSTSVVSKQNDTEIVGASGQKAESSSSSSSASTASSSSASASSSTASAPASQPSTEQRCAALNMTEDYRASFAHGKKDAQFQKYIVLHDTESLASASNIVDGWDNGTGVAAHFVVNRDGSIVQCVALDTIAHHAGFGDTGHNALYGVEDESRDDKVGTTPIGDWASDYGMNSYSIGIEMVHVGDGDDYTAEQLDAVDKLIAYIDSYYGNASKIIDHKMWRSGNSDTSDEFAGYLANYQDHRTHN